MNVWFPDLVAKWYDAFVELSPRDYLDAWSRRDLSDLEREYTEGLIKNPQAQATRIDQFVRNNNLDMIEAERLFVALRAASEAVLTVGFRVPLIDTMPEKVAGKGSKRALDGTGTLAAVEWKHVRKHWRDTGNLLREWEGHLLPGGGRPHEWLWPSVPQSHLAQSAFQGFIRWSRHDRIEYNRLELRTVVIPMLPPPALHQVLRVGVVPLVASRDDLIFTATELEPGTPSFTVRLRDPEAVGRAAISALDRCVAEECDIVVFPELCLTPELQSRLGEHLRRPGLERPWLVVAGTALVPDLDRPGRHHNQAVVFGIHGAELLRQHKLHRYTISPREQKRYRLEEELGGQHRHEDITTEPPRLTILDTPVGRLAVLICEDLAAFRFVESVIDGLALDWLLVPVLDGNQTSGCWTAKNAIRYAEMGTAVVVVTSHGMAEQHRSTDNSPAPPPPGVGHLTRPRKYPRPAPDIRLSGVHDQPVVFPLEPHRE